MITWFLVTAGVIPRLDRGIQVRDALLLTHLRTSHSTFRRRLEPQQNTWRECIYLAFATITRTLSRQQKTNHSNPTKHHIKISHAKLRMNM
jgi:hypothetical protein